MYETQILPIAHSRSGLYGAERLAEVTPLRRVEAKENGELSEFQAEMVHLAAVLGGDHFLSSFPDELSKKMSVKEAHDYVKAAMARFLEASKGALRMGANPSSIVNMRASLSTRTSTSWHRG